MIIKKLLDNTDLPIEIINILLIYIPYCFYCTNYSQKLEIEFSSLLSCYCDLDDIYCIHNVKYICNDCSNVCECGAVIYKYNIH